MGQKPSATSGVWERLSQVPEGPLADFLAGEHPQTAALILSKMRPESPARVPGRWRPELRNPLVRRGAARRPGPAAALRLPQSGALILSKMRSESAARVLGRVPPELRNALMRRMAALKPVTAAALRLLESEVHEALITQLERSSASEAYVRMADILNRMESA